MVHSAEKVKGPTDPVKQEHYMRSTLQHFDLENSGTLTVEQFLKAAHRMSCTLNEGIAGLFFEKFGAGNGELDYERMARELFRGD